MNKFEEAINFLIEQTPPDAPVEDPNAAGGQPEETPNPEEQMPPEEPEQDVDVEALTIQFTQLVMQALQFGLDYGQEKNAEIKTIISSMPYDVDEAITKLDQIKELMDRNIPPSTDYRGPGVKNQ